MAQGRGVETACLIPPRDLAALADKLKLLAADPAMRDRFGQEGRRRFTDVFRHEHMTEQLRALYTRMLAEPNAATQNALDATDRG